MHIVGVCLFYANSQLAVRWLTFVNKIATHFDEVLFYEVSGENAVFYSQVVYIMYFTAESEFVFG